MENILLSQEFQSFIMELLLVVIAAAVPVLVQRLVVFANLRINELRAYIPQEHLAFIDSLAERAVQAAEQSGLAGHIENVGKAKLDKATSDIQDMLNSLGWSHIPASVIRLAIEAAVLRGVQHPEVLIAEEINLED